MDGNCEVAKRPASFKTHRRPARGEAEWLRRDVGLSRSERWGTGTEVRLGALRTERFRGLRHADQASMAQPLIPLHELALGEQCLSLRGRLRESKGSIPGQYPAGGCWESEARSYSAYPGFGGRKSSRFLGRKRWKSQKQNSVLSPNSVAVNGFGPKHPRSLTPMELQWNNVGTPANTPDRRGPRAYLHHSPRVRTRRSRRRHLSPCEGLSRVAERLPSPGSLSPATETPQGLRLRRKGQSMLLHHRQLQGQQTLLRGSATTGYGPGWDGSASAVATPPPGARPHRRRRRRQRRAPR